MMSEAMLYLTSSIISLIAFILSLVFYFTDTEYKELILLVGIISLAKSVEYFEKYTFKSKPKDGFRI